MRPRTHRLAGSLVAGRIALRLTTIQANDSKTIRNLLVRVLLNRAAADSLREPDGKRQADWLAHPLRRYIERGHQLGEPRESMAQQFIERTPSEEHRNES